MLANRCDKLTYLFKILELESIILNVGSTVEQWVEFLPSSYKV